MSSARAEQSGRPLVSIGMPVYNRASTLKRAVESALAQDYQNVEVVISDDASPDGTQALCEDMCGRDRRINYIRQARNIGPVANFRETLVQSKGEFFLWLCDDDWLDTDYVSQCVRVLQEHPDHALVWGAGKYYRDGNYSHREPEVDLLEDSGSERVVSYCKKVGKNGTNFGVMRRERVAREVRFGKELGWDWYVIAQIAFIGKIKTLTTTAIHRAIEGSSEDVERLARNIGMTGFMARNPFLKISMNFFQDIVWESPIYKSLSFPQRMSLGVEASRAILDRYCVPTWKSRMSERLDRSPGLKSALKRAVKFVNRANAT